MSYRQQNIPAAPLPATVSCQQVERPLAIHNIDQTDERISLTLSNAERTQTFGILRGADKTHNCTANWVHDGRVVHCWAGFQTKQQLNHHRATCHDLQPWTCSAADCSQWFADPANANKHARSCRKAKGTAHGAEKLWRCTYCDHYVCRRSDNVKRHAREAHRNVPGFDETRAVEKVVAEINEQPARAQEPVRAPQRRAKKLTTRREQVQLVPVNMEVETTDPVFETKPEHWFALQNGIDPTVLYGTSAFPLGLPINDAQTYTAAAWPQLPATFSSTAPSLLPLTNNSSSFLLEPNQPATLLDNDPSLTFGDPCILEKNWTSTPQQSMHDQYPDLQDLFDNSDTLENFGFPDEWENIEIQ